MRAKIVSHDQLLAQRARLRSEGKRVVQCHGCFDIVHPGHIRHLRQAKSLGDVLLVTLTGDREIKKGTGRPLIPEELRAENLAALDFVDLVYVEQRPTALELLGEVCPDVYVKGKEYEHNHDPRFTAERNAVERSGGRVVFSSGDVVFSSSALIAAMEKSVDPFHARLEALQNHPDLQGHAIFQTLTAIRGKRVVIVGETILDTYILCDRPEVAGESPVLTLRPLEARHYDGGAAVVARHAAAMGASPVLVTPLPDTPQGVEVRQRLLAEGVEVRALPVPTPIPEKQRFLVGAQKIVKLDLLEPYLLDQAQQARLHAMAADAAGDQGGCDAAILTDFGLGLFSPKSLHDLCTLLRPKARVLSGDVSGKRSSLLSMRGADLLCPSEIELRESLRAHAEGIPAVAWRLLEETHSRRAIITLGSDGLVAFDRVHDPAPDHWPTRLTGEHIPALAPLAIDPLGCGDALLAAATLALAAGAPLLASAFLGACAAAVQVQRLGNNPVSASDLRQSVIRVQSAHMTFAPGSIDSREPAVARAG